MSLTKKVYLTISGYDIKLSDNLTFYQKDQLKLIFYINEYGINYENNATTRALMPVNPLNAILFIENPEGVDSVSSAKIEDNAVTFYLDSTHTQYVGVSRMQLRLFDQDGCAITLPHFTFEIRENIYGSGDVRFQNVVMVDQTGTVILTEDNDLLDVGDILTMGTEVAYPQVTKTIKELPIKHGLDGTEKLIVEDNEATKQAPLGTIVDEIKQNSQEKIREIESELAQTNAQLSQLELSNNNKKIFNVKDYGAKGDGVTPDHVAIKKAINDLIKNNGGILYFPNGTYLHGDASNPHYQDGDDPFIGEDISFTIENLSHFKIEGYNAVIKSHPNNSCIANNRIFHLRRCTDFSIFGIEINGSIQDRMPSGGDADKYNYQSNITLDACRNVVLRDVTSNYSVMDGLTISSTTLFEGINEWSENIIVDNCQFNYNYRQGVSVINAKNVKFDSCEASYTGTIYGTPPCSGIDFEENFNSKFGRGQYDCVVENSRFIGNARKSVRFYCGTNNSVFKNNYCDTDFLIQQDLNSNNSTEDYLVTNNTVENNTFINSSIISYGGGSHIKNNRLISTDLTKRCIIECYDKSLASRVGKSRPSCVVGNTIDIMLPDNKEDIPESVNLGAILVSGDDMIVDGNTVTNPLVTSNENSKYLFGINGGVNRTRRMCVTNNKMIWNKDYTFDNLGRIHFIASCVSSYNNNEFVGTGFYKSEQIAPKSSYTEFVESDKYYLKKSFLLNRQTVSFGTEFINIVLPLKTCTIKLTVNNGFYSGDNRGITEEIRYIKYDNANNTIVEDRALLVTLFNAHKGIVFSDAFIENDKLNISVKTFNNTVQESQLIVEVMLNHSTSVLEPFISSDEVYLNNLPLSDLNSDLNFKYTYSTGTISTLIGIPSETYFKYKQGLGVYSNSKGKAVWWDGNKWVDANGTRVD